MAERSMPTTCSLFSANTPKALVWRHISALQLALNFFECRGIRSSDGELASENRVQHVKECVRWKFRQLCQHGQSPEANLTIPILSGNPPARHEHAEVDENTGDQLDRTLQRAAFCDNAKGTDRIRAAMNLLPPGRSEFWLYRIDKR
jgi:hypothetical protein